jgi:putative SOS response-associated peptidase YedK
MYRISSADSSPYKLIPSPSTVFASIWRPWTGLRGTKADPVEGERLLYSFLTSESNDLVELIGRKAVPVVLTTLEGYEVWLNAPTEEALRLQRPLPDEMLPIVAERDKSDKPGEAKSPERRA